MADHFGDGAQRFPHPPAAMISHVPPPPHNVGPPMPPPHGVGPPMPPPHSVGPPMPPPGMMQMPLGPPPTIRPPPNTFRNIPGQQFPPWNQGAPPPTIPEQANISVTPAVQRAETPTTNEKGNGDVRNGGSPDEANNVSLKANQNSNANNDESTVNTEEAEKPKKELVLPKALEDALAFKHLRAAEYHVNADDFTSTEGTESNSATNNANTNYTGYAGDESDEDGEGQINGSDLAKPVRQSKAEKNKKKKRRKKQNKKLRKQKPSQDIQNSDTDSLKEEENTNKVVNEVDADDNSSPKKKPEPKEKKIKTRKTATTKIAKKSDAVDDVSIEYVPEKITIADLAPMYRQFYRVFEIFKLEHKTKQVEKDKSTNDTDVSSSTKKSSDKVQEDEDDEGEDDLKQDKEKLSKRKLKKLTRLSVAELKQLVSRPDVVEMHDVTARDPKLLVQLKAYRNTVQVPRHWCFKRKYLQGKRGIEKPPFDLPAFIKKTGIMEMRESLQEKDTAKSLKSKMRERVRPKMGKIDIDYQKLHDAFFKWQTKPRMTIHGDLYYEGKEYETRLKEKKPGDLSEELRIALGMPVGPSAHKIPPPWLIAQQRYGPPPSYPSLKIPGLNAPIPDGTSFGYHAGGWGKPPVDENGKPLYGDVFGTNIMELENGLVDGDIERNQWGELETESEESSDEEEDEGEDLTNVQDESGLVTPAEGLITPSGLTSIPAGMETPESIELRKRKIEAEMEDNETPVLYQVLPEKRTDRVGASMMGSTHVYDIASVGKQQVTRSSGAIEREGTIELALDPSELDMDTDAMAQRYEQQMREQQNHLQKEDLSDMLAEHVARQKSKRKRQQAEPQKTSKKYKEFKF